MNSVCVTGAKGVKFSHNEFRVSSFSIVSHDCILSPCLLNLYTEYMMRNAGWMKPKMESRLLGEISITSDMQMTPPLWQKVKKN